MKTYILDTNVILSSYKSLMEFKGCVLIPISVIVEMDTFKKDKRENGMNARAFARFMDSLRKKGSLVSGIKQKQTIIKVFADQLNPIVDDDIIDIAKKLKSDGKNITIVTLDLNLRIKADIAGITAIGYESPKKYKETAKTHKIILSDTKTIDSIFENKVLKLSSNKRLINGQHIVLQNKQNKQSALCVYRKNDHSLHLIKNVKKIFGLEPRSVEQRFLMDSLLDDSKKIVIVESKAGCGKTVVSLACGLHQVMETGLYSKLLITKSPTPVGGKDELGFMPGDFEEKMSHWTYNFKDNFFFLGQANSIKEDDIEQCMEVCSIQHMRGRSLHNTLIIVDEFQNLSPLAAKTIITRIGEGSKIICLGDISQIDHAFMDQRHNGLSFIMNRFKGQDLAAIVRLEKSERSALANLAADIL